MTEKNYIDIKGMEKRVAEKNQEQAEQFHTELNAITERNEQAQAETNALFTKALQSEREDAEKRRASEMEAEKAKATQAIEAKYEEQGVKSEQTQRTDVALKKMLKNIPGLND